jgi:hypothetical protein
VAIGEWVLIAVNAALVIVTCWYASATNRSLKQLRKQVAVTALMAEIMAADALREAGSQNQRPAIQALAEELRKMRP